MDATSMTPFEEQAVRDNIFSAAHGAIANWKTFKWHCSERVDAHVPHSSQAFCISVWGTFASQQGRVVRDVVASVLQDALFLEVLEQYKTELPLVLESDSRELLNEFGGKQSHLDGVLSLNGLSVVIESKFTEPFGACSQVRDKHCSGVYGPGSDLKLKRDEFPCRLQYKDRQRTPRLYWEIMKPLSNEGVYPLGKPCPFAEGGYQVMRNIAAAAALATANGSEWRVIFEYPKSSDSRTADTIAFVKGKLAVEQQQRILVLDYVELAEKLMRSEDATAISLGRHMAKRLNGQELS
jgi:hypothetical protein